MAIKRSFEDHTRHARQHVRNVVRLYARQPFGRYASAVLRREVLAPEDCTLRELALLEDQAKRDGVTHEAAEVAAHHARLDALTPEQLQQEWDAWLE